MNKIQTISSVIQALSTVALVIFTILYVSSTIGMKDAMLNQSEVMTKQYENMLKQSEIISNQSETMLKQFEIMSNQSQIMSDQLDIMLRKFEISDRPYIVVNQINVEYIDFFKTYLIYIDFMNKMQIPAKLNKVELNIHYYDINPNLNDVHSIEDLVNPNPEEPIVIQPIEKYLDYTLIFPQDISSTTIFVTPFYEESLENKAFATWLDKRFKKMTLKLYYEDTSQKENVYCTESSMFYDKENKKITDLESKSC